MGNEPEYLLLSTYVRNSEEHEINKFFFGGSEYTLVGFSAN
jgi:hypothetical protein